MKNLRLLSSMLVLSPGALVSATHGAKGQVTMLPTYVEGVQARPGVQQGSKLADRLKVPASRLLQAKGLLSFVDADRFLAVPKHPLQENPQIAAQLKATKNLYPSIPIDGTPLDLEALSKQKPLENAAALRLAADTLAASGLSALGGTPVVGHATFTTVTTNAAGAAAIKNSILDTHVRYRFSLHNLPLVGPGAQIQLHFDSAGNVTRFHYSARQLSEGPSVRIISEAEARGRFLKQVPGRTDLKLRLVYWAPPMNSGGDLGTGETILPWYACSSTTRVTDPASHLAHTINSRVRMIPATDDPRFVPQVKLTASTPRQSLINAQCQVTGGRAPYHYLWAGSNPETAATASNSISYVPMVRDAHTWLPNLPLQRTEHVVVTVIDANGIPAQADETVTVVPQMMPGQVRGGVNAITYGCESPNDPTPSVSDGTYAPERIAWQQAMGAPGAGGGTQSFCWLESDSWPGDFIQPNPANSLPAKPWIYGDANYSNWGVNTANIVLYNGDGWPDGFAEMYAGAVPNDYNAAGGASLARPFNPGGTVGIAGTNYSVNYSPSWGPLATGGSLYWLAFYACQILEDLPTDDERPWVRWGPAFNGLHSMVGFFSPASDNGVGFSGDFPRNMLGVGQAPQTVVQAWLNAAIADDMGTPAAMGPIWSLNVLGFQLSVTDYNDHYWGKGAVGMTIPPSLVNGWWYVKGDDAVQDFP